MRRDARDALSRAMTDAFPETSLERARGTSLLLEACVSDKAAAAGDGQYHRRISTLVQSFGRWKKRCPALRRIHKFAAIGPDRDAAIGAAAEAGAWELAPDALRLQAAWLRDAERASARADASANAPFSGGTCEGVACKRCHKMNVSSHREQRRAADEPETEIFVCKSCGLQWTAR